MTDRPRPTPRLAAVALPATLAALIAAPAFGVAVNIDFSGSRGGVPGPAYTGDAALPGSGPTFNNIPFQATYGAFTTSPLLDGSGATTAITLTNNTAATPTNGLASFNTNSFGFVSNEAQALMQDYISVGQTGSTPLSLTLNNLSPTTPYQLYLYGAGDNANQATQFTVNGAATSQQSTTGPQPDAITPNLTLGEDYVVFDGVLPTSGGTINIQAFRAIGNNFASFNGLQIQPSPVAVVPEPATAGLLAAGVGATLLRRRRPMSA